MPGRIRLVEVELGVKGIRPVKFRCKSIENTLPVKGIRLVELGVNPLRSKAFNQAAILCTGRHTNVISVNFQPI